MPEINPADAVAAAATAAPVEGKPAEAVADAAKSVAESTPAEGKTLLGEEGKKEGVTVTPEVKNVPEKYEFKVPEGMTLDQGLLDAVTPVFKELGITQEGAQKLADAYAPKINQMMESQRQSAVAEFNKMVDGWKDQTVKELGAGHEKELAHAARFIDKNGGTELRQVLQETGFGNHPLIVKAFVAAGKMMANDSFPDSSNKGKSIDSEESRAAVLFPTQKPS